MRERGFNPGALGACAAAAVMVGAAALPGPAFAAKTSKAKGSGVLGTSHPAKGSPVVFGAINMRPIRVLTSQRPGLRQTLRLTTSTSTKTVLTAIQSRSTGVSPTVRCQCQATMPGSWLRITWLRSSVPVTWSIRSLSPPTPRLISLTWAK